MNISILVYFYHAVQRLTSESSSDMLFSSHLLFFSSYSSPVENASIIQDRDAGAAKASCLPTTEEAAELKDDNCISKEESCWDSHDSDGLFSDNAAEGAEDCKGPKNTQVKLKQSKNEADAAYPEPRLPFPCMSSLSSQEQKMYLGTLMSKKKRNPPEVLVFSLMVF